MGMKEQYLEKRLPLFTEEETRWGTIDEIKNEKVRWELTIALLTKDWNRVLLALKIVEEE